MKLDKLNKDVQLDTVYLLLLRNIIIRLHIITFLRFIKIKQYRKPAIADMLVKAWRLSIHHFIFTVIIMMMTIIISYNDINVLKER